MAFPWVGHSSLPSCLDLHFLLCSDPASAVAAAAYFLSADLPVAARFVAHFPSCSLKFQLKIIKMEQF